MQEIKLDPQEVKELLAIADKHNGHFLDDCEQAELIYNMAKREGLCMASDNISCLNSYAIKGTVFRIAYIAGQRSARRGGAFAKPADPAPLVTKPLSREQAERLFKSMSRVFKGGVGVTAEQMRTLFGERLARRAMRYVTGLMPRGWQYWDEFSACGHTTRYLHRDGFYMATLGYCNDFIGKETKA